MAKVQLRKETPKPLAQNSDCSPGPLGWVWLKAAGGKCVGKKPPTKTNQHQQTPTNNNNTMNIIRRAQMENWVYGEIRQYVHICE